MTASATRLVWLRRDRPTLTGLVALVSESVAVVLLALAAQYAVAVLGKGFDFETQIELAQRRYGRPAQQTVQDWRALLISLQAAPELEKIRRVNTFFNHRIQFRDDVDIWNRRDYWATPLETMGRAQGDCEDFAIAKYFSLLLLGLPTDRLRLTYVKAHIGGPQSRTSQAHMILGYYPAPDSEPLILDNLLNDVRPASRRPDLLPVFSFNSEGIWVGNSTSGRSGGNATARLSHWRDVIARMHADGFE